MFTPRALAALLLSFLALSACAAPDAPPDGTEGQVVRELRAPLDRTWRETVAAIHSTGVAVPHDQRPAGALGQIRTDVLRVDLVWQEDGTTTVATILYYDRDFLRARARGESLLDMIEDRLDRR